MPTTAKLKLNVSHVRQIQFILSRQGQPNHVCGRLSGPHRSISQNPAHPINKARHHILGCCSNHTFSSSASSSSSILHPTVHGNVSRRALSTSASLLKCTSNSGNSDSDRKPVHCPSCGSETCHVESFTGSTRFAKCGKCHHFFTVTADPETKAEDCVHHMTQLDNQPLPPPKKIFEFLNKFVVGQEEAKKVLCVAVYNHYKRINNNIPPTLSSANKNLAAEIGPNGSKDGSPSLNQVNPLSIFHQHVGPEAPSPDIGSSEPRGSQLLESHTQELKLDKSNILLLGPTGSGKTLLAQTIAQCLDVPFAMCDCTSITQAGYVGEDIDSVIAKLLANANYDVNRAQKGIVFLDEVDKLGCIPGVHQLRDVGGEGVQQGLLKLLEGTSVHIQDKATRSRMKGDNATVDTTNVLFVASGAFTGLERIVGKRKQEKYLGFGAPTNTHSRRAVTNEALSNLPEGDENAEKDALLSQVEARDLIKYGLIPEFCGRFPVNVSLGSLNEDMLVKILTEPQNALVLQFEALFKMDKCQLTITKDGLQAIAKKAVENQTGARGLRHIIERILLEPQYHIPGSDVQEVIIDADVVAGVKQPLYIHRQEEDYEDEESDEREQRTIKV
ncbi:ATP-dependent clpX-like chaperone, mitochondrial [Amphiura filiformis]|uniref:ATP-dependent clpX-like chaperone, mitochondrial n=1 Tax=Amphiura filiformis TaxID=82378 RepID=UPI003B2157E6